jgi:hypothetical protein
MRWIGCALFLLLSGGDAERPGARALAGSTSTGPTSPPKFRVGTVKADAIREGSGLVASRRHAGVFWTLSDGGNPAALYAITREGDLIRAYPVAADNVDWEDLAVDGEGRLYVADVGNNRRDRKEIRVIRVDEPDPRAPLRGRPAPLRVTRTWRLTFPAGGPFDCEALFVHGGKGYLIPKRLNVAPAELFQFDLGDDPGAATPVPARPAVLERVAELPAVRGPVTAADLSGDGKRLALLTVLGPYVFDLEGEPGGGIVEALAKAKVSHSRYIDVRMEAACLVDGGLLVTTENRDVLLFRDEHFTPVAAQGQ